MIPTEITAAVIKSLCGYRDTAADRDTVTRRRLLMMMIASPSLLSGVGGHGGPLQLLALTAPDLHRISTQV